MNEQIKELAKQAGFISLAIYNMSDEIERFAELVRQDEREQAEKQEPVAWMVRDQVDGCRYPSALKNPASSINGESKPLYTAPPKREWVGLTEEEKQAAYLKIDAWSACVDFIEAKLKEKNT